MGSSKRDPRAYPVDRDERAYRRLIDTFASLANKHPIIAAGDAAIKDGINPIVAATVALRRLAGEETLPAVGGDATVIEWQRWERDGTTKPRAHLVQPDGSILCHAGNDGDCAWRGCPQLRDGEPERSKRHCPLDTDDDDA